MADRIQQLEEKIRNLEGNVWNLEAERDNLQNRNAWLDEELEASRQKEK